MKHIFCTICMVLLVFSMKAQQDTLKPVRVIAGDMVDFTVDNLGNLLTLDKNNQLKKIDARGDSIAVYNNVRQYGKLDYIDATNPLKLLLFYKDYGNIVVLDRLLNVRTNINLRRLNIFQAPAISQSYDNGIWVYDQQEAKIKRLDTDGNLRDQSADFRLFMEVNPSPVSMIDQDKLLYLYDPLRGVFVFDYFLTLKNKIPLLGWEDFQVVNGNLFGRKGTTIYQYQPGTLTIKEQSFPVQLARVSKMKISHNSIYCLVDGAIRVYAL